MEGTVVTAGQEKPQKRVRFRVASGNSGRVLKEMFKDEGPSDSLDSDCTSSSDAERASTPSTTGEVHGHLYGFLGSELDDSESEPDELLVYAGGTKDWMFTTKRVNILSKNGTVRGVKHKVSAGQTLFENLPNAVKTTSRCVMRTAAMTEVTGQLKINDAFHYVFQEKLISLDIVLVLQGAEKILGMNESGELQDLLTKIERVQHPHTCQTCGGFAFIPCPMCHGSKMSVFRNCFTDSFKALKCTSCNENGLQPCASCSQ
ncbi:glutaredoxin and cysteine rich domain containing 1 [Nothobranchius furzeri]|uniref:Glutaredoxin and cysteine rich domain containing 1 n=1 Tax=Nothobranchius furzeri TaxID=105023 RepID=A0A9D3BRR8_NOTFU|nr:glutaredoxin and cysteine rich domain containing 1 [Nothobranchius furzeri]